MAVMPNAVCFLQASNEALQDWSCLNRPASGGGSSGSMAALLVVSSVNWAVLTINITCLSSSYTADGYVTRPSVNHAIGLTEIF